MVQTSNSAVNIPAEDDFGITYYIADAHQFWSELHDILSFSKDGPTLSMLDTALRRFVSLCASYHEYYLQLPLQLESACRVLFDSELFKFHSERMCELAIDDVQSKTDPHGQFILYSVLLFWGRDRPAFFRSHKRWQPLIPLLMDHVSVEIDPELDDSYVGPDLSSSGAGSRASIIMGPIVIEGKLRALAVRLLYEVCRVQKLSGQDLHVFSDLFISHLFELVEQTRFMPDETFNYSVIKLTVALNEQFMVASLSNATSADDGKGKAHGVRNRVFDVLKSRLDSSKTFGANMIFMLNRASRSAEDLCMQLLVLKLLFILFTSNETSEYFYTNDLRVLVDVFLRELVDLDDESGSLRHTYLRVLHPLLTKTQLRNIPYKRPQIVMALESLTRNANIRNIDPTTKRLVERCLSGDWCVNLRKSSFDKDALDSQDSFRQASPSHDILASTTQAGLQSRGVESTSSEKPNDSGILPPVKAKHTKPSHSAENIKSYATKPVSSRSGSDGVRRPSMESATSLGVVASTTTNPPKRREKPGSMDDSSLLQQAGKNLQLKHYPHAPPSPTSSAPPSTPSTSIQKTRRPPPAPPKRRQPPPAPLGQTRGGALITTIASSSLPTNKR